MTAENEQPPGGTGEKGTFRDKKTDESWKEKAREEKKKLEGVPPPEERQEFPPASFLGLLDELSLRVMLALGQIRNPGSNEVYLDLEAAQYSIDLLQVLEEKTKGNLDREEEATLKDVLHNLRLLFVHVSRAAAAAPGASPEGRQGPPRGDAPAQPPPEKPGPKIIL